MEQNSWSVSGGAPAIDAAGESEFARLFGFFKPQVAMRDVVMRPAWFVPLFLATLAGMAYMVVARQNLTWNSSQVIMGTAGVAANLCIRTALSAGLLTLFAAWVSRAPVQFRQVFAIVAYSRMPGVMITVLSIVLILLRRASGLPDSHPIDLMLTNLAIFLNPDTTSPFVYTMARSVDCVIFWQLSLIAVGLKMASGLSSTATNVAVVILWALTAIAQSAWVQWATAR